MSKDIRSYFALKNNLNATSKIADSKKTIEASSSHKQKFDVKKKRRRILSDSEGSDDGISDFKLKNGKNEHSSPKKNQISNKTKSPKKNGAMEIKKEVKLTNIFSSEPIKRINSLNKKHTAGNSKAKVEKSISSAIGIHPDEKFNETLIALDNRNDSKAKIKEMYNNAKNDALKNTEHNKNMVCEINGNLNSSCVTNKLEKNDKSDITTIKSSSTNKRQHSTDEGNSVAIKNENIEFMECDVINETIYDPSPSKVNKSVESIKSPQNNVNDTPNKSLMDSSKKRKRKASTSVSELTDEERHEHKRHAAMLYKKFLNRSGPKHLGSKEVPKGSPNCLKGTVFLITGVLDSFERNEVSDIIKECGGEVKQTLSGKVTHLICGEDAGPAKIAKAESLNINIISEDGFLDLIRKKSCELPEQDTKVNIKNQNTPRKEKNKTEVKTKTKQSTNKTCKVDLNDKMKKHVKAEESKYFKKDDNDDETSNERISTLKNDSALSSPKKMQEKDTSKSQWVEKYKPITSKQIIGQNGESSNVAKLTTWLSKWYQNRKLKLPPPNPWSKGGDGGYYKAALLSGPPGVGKTTTASLVCKELGFDIVEFNASDTRSKNLLKEHMSELTTMNSLSGFVHGTKPLTKKHAIIMDEVDGMAGNEDRGGMQELIALIKKTSVPIICICNDKTSPKMRSLSNCCFDLTYSKPKLEQIKGFLCRICFKEGIKIAPQSLDEIIIGASQDIRQILNLLSLWTASNKDISTNSISKDSKSSKKDIKLGPWTVLRTVFTKEEHKNMSISEKSDLFFHDYSLAPLFVQQNYLKVIPACPRKEVLDRFAEAADSLCIGDITERKIRNSMAWNLLPIQAMCSSVIPGSILSGHIQGLIDFPSWLGQNSRTNKINRIVQEIRSHIKLSTSGSKDSIRLDYGFHIYESIIRPLINEGIDGIDKAIDTLRAYHLTREDLDSLMELNSWPKTKNKMSLIDSKVKTAFTKKYNKEAVLLPYSKAKTKTSSKETDLDIINSESSIYEQIEENDDSDIESDVMIKKKKKPAVATKKDHQKTNDNREKKQKNKKKK